MRKYVTENSGMADSIMDTIDALLPMLPGNPEDYVSVHGRLDIEEVVKGSKPHSHSTEAASKIILQLWTGQGPLSKAINHCGGHKAKQLANALHILATHLEGKA